MQSARSVWKEHKTMLFVLWFLQYHVKFWTFSCCQSETRINQRSVMSENDEFGENGKLSQESNVLKCSEVWSLVISAWGLWLFDKTHLLQSSLNRFWWLWRYIRAHVSVSNIFITWASQTFSSQLIIIVCNQCKFVK